MNHTLTLCRSGHCHEASEPSIYWKDGKCKICRWVEEREAKKPVTTLGWLRMLVESL